MKKLRLRNELAYIGGMLFLSLGVALQSKANIGISVLAAPAYLLSQKVGFLSFGMADYIMQITLITVLCIIKRKVPLKYILSFASALLYGALLDVMTWLIHPIVVTGIINRTLVFLLGAPILSAIGVTLFFRTNLPLIPCDLFVRELAGTLKVRVEKLKIGYDLSFCVLSLILSFSLFGALRGLGVGTVVYSLFNGLVIALWGGIIDKFVVFSNSEEAKAPEA